MTLLELQPNLNAGTDLPPAAGNLDMYDERWLVTKAKSGQDDAFGELYKRHHSRIYRTALRILRNQQDAEDAAQKAFQRAFVNLKRFRGDSTFTTWLTRIVINESLMLLRQRRASEPIHENRVGGEQMDQGLAIRSTRLTPEELLWQTERRAALFHAISKLREKLRTIVFHRELEGLTSAETAQILGLSVSAVKARAFHARRFLRRHLERKFDAGESVAKPQKE